ncbi:MAG: uncharacterized protein A8A55_3329, partial [Amphiamblys sp. WSBS2006]
DENQRVWAGRVKNLQLRDYAVNLLPKLVENQMQEIHLSAEDSSHVRTILEAEDRSIWVGRVKKMVLREYAVEILLKLRFHEENGIEEISLFACSSGQITGILEEEDNNIWVGRVKNLVLAGYAVEILSKLRFHEEDGVEGLLLSADDSGQINKILETEDNSLWVGKVKELYLRGYTVEILPKLRFHEENVIEGLLLSADKHFQINKILETEDNSVWVGMVKKIDLCDHSVEILPKLRFYEEIEIEELLLSVEKPGQINKILETEDNSLWMGKVKEVYLRGYTVEILPKLRFHKENVIEGLLLSADDSCHVSTILGAED